ncbi:hypothetical protein [Microbacterium sp. KNMS]
MTEGVSVALVTTIGGILVAVIGVLGASINSKLGRVRAQVENDHSTNLREELDARHNETRGWFSAIWNRLESGDRKFDHLERRISNLERKDQHHEPPHADPE